MIRLAAAPTAKIVTTNASAATARAAIFPAYTASRDGPRVSTVFQVSQPYSLPTASTPRTTMIAPRNTGRPATELPTSCAGTTSARPRSAVGPPVPVLYPAYGITYVNSRLSTSATASSNQFAGRLTSLTSSAATLPDI